MIKSGENLRDYEVNMNNEDMFENFWLMYPRKIGKTLARKRWKKLGVNQEMYDVIMMSLTEHCELRQWQNKEYIPHASTWLNQRRFEDDISDEPKARGLKKRIETRGSDGLTFKERYNANKKNK